MLSSMLARCLLLLLAPCAVRGERFFEHDSGSLRTLQKAEVHADWKLFSRSGPKPTHIRQGSGDNGYFLAALAAIANTHPQIIKEAFIMKGKDTSTSGEKVYQVRFLIGGVETIVAMDETVPANMTMTKKTPRRLFFSKVNNGSAVWPILMEKGWAKLKGSYGATESGDLHEAFVAITQAPVDTVNFWGNIPDMESLWNALVEGFSKGFPIGATSQDNSIGVAADRSFAVIGLDEGSGAVQLYDPSKHSGKKKKQFVFKLTFDEFTKAFESIEVARVERNYRISFRRVPVNEPVALQFTTTQQAAFSVQLDWPTTSIDSTYGCGPLHPTAVKLLAVKKGGGNWKAGVWKGESNVRVDFDEEGTYLVYAYVSFTAPVVAHAAVNVYASEDLDISEVSALPLLVGREILGWPCQFLMLREKRSFEMLVFEAVHFTVEGSPAWKRWGSEALIWVDRNGDLAMANSCDSLYKANSRWRLSRKKLQCREMLEYTAPEEEADSVKEMDEKCSGLFDFGKSVSSKSGCDFHAGEKVGLWIDREERWQKAEVMEADGDTVVVEHPSYTQQELECNDGNRVREFSGCEKLFLEELERPPQLNNVEEILEEGTDSLFPPELDSIAPPDTYECLRLSCERLNTWGTLSDVLK